MGELIRIGGRLFNLDHVSSIEPVDDRGQLAVDIHIVAGRSVRLVGDDAKAATFFVSSYPSLPVDQAAQDQAERQEQAAQDSHLRQFNSDAEKIRDPRH